ncbi:MAG: hypothetical protein R3C56_35715 [Pirellulaceae bacterium]
MNKPANARGAPLYMSPEQLCGRVDWLDGHSDIYAMGVIFTKCSLDARRLTR